MKVALCYFAYSGDAPLLDLALQAVPRLRAQGHIVDVYVVDDAASPMKEPPSGCRYWTTRFNRKGNLNGSECICGMVDVYNAIFKNGMYEWVLKVDCDTFVNSLDWLVGISSQIYSFAGTTHRQDYCTGSCYAVSRNAAEWLKSRFQEPSWRGAAQRGFCEDKVLYNMCKLSGMPVHALQLKDTPDGKLWHDWEGEPLPFAELKTAYAVDFKACRWNSRKENWEQDKQNAIERMRQYTQFLSYEN